MVLVASDWCSVTSWLLRALFTRPFCGNILGAVLSLLWSVQFCWKEHFVEDGKIAKTRPVQPLPVCCDARKLLAHFHVPLTFLRGCKVCWHPVLRSSKGLLPTSKGQPHQNPRLNTQSWEYTVAQGKDSSQKICFFVSTCLCVNLFIVD